MYFNIGPLLIFFLITYNKIDTPFFTFSSPVLYIIKSGSEFVLGDETLSLQ